MYLSTRMKAFLFLILIGILGGIVPLLTKVALTEFNSHQVLFIRFGMGAVLIIPLLLKYIKHVSIKKIVTILPAGLLFSGNVFFFVVGVQYTTGIVSQLLYLLAPVFVSIIGYFILKEKISWRRIFSMAICFGGSSLLIIRSIQGGNLIRSIGTF